MKQEWDDKLECFLKASLKKNTAVVRKQASTYKKGTSMYSMLLASVPAAFVSCFLSGFNHFLCGYGNKAKIKIFLRKEDGCFIIFSIFKKAMIKKHMCLWKLAGGNSSCWCLWTILNKKSVGERHVHLELKVTVLDYKLMSDVRGKGGGEEGSSPDGVIKWCTWENFYSQHTCLQQGV